MVAVVAQAVVAIVVVAVVPEQVHQVTIKYYLNLSKMKEKIKNEEILSRRGFFKKAAKGVLPILGAVALGVTNIENVSAQWGNNCYCGRSCQGYCNGACTGKCAKSCSGSCSGSSKGGW
jgi:CXXX repeat radical SAM target protein